ncbi:MAG: sodium:proton antiporter [Polyangiaceae bacterium]
MTAFETIAAIVSVSALFAYLNHRWLRQPASVALMALSLSLSLACIAVDRMGWIPLRDVATRALERVDFNQALMHGMLGLLLFAGSLHVKLEDLRRQRIAIAALALVSTLLSTFLVGAIARVVSGTFGLGLTMGQCMLFGALISPTDPVAVLDILRQARVPKSMEIQIAGESLFNDGVGVVVFATIYGIVARGHAATFDETILHFAREAIGGALFGLALGYITFRLLRSIDHYQTELLLTLALVLGGYSLAEKLHISAAIAAVTSGLVIGNYGRTEGMSDVTRDHLDKFWSLIDEVLNAALFVMLGLEGMRLDAPRGVVWASLAVIPAVLAARLVSVALPLAAVSRYASFGRGTLTVLTWGGLRGGISVALALSIPAGEARNTIVVLTYVVVVFSILVQGLSLGTIARRFAAERQRP